MKDLSHNLSVPLHVLMVITGRVLLKNKYKLRNVVVTGSAQVPPSACILMSDASGRGVGEFPLTNDSMQLRLTVDSNLMPFRTEKIMDVDVAGKKREYSPVRQNGKQIKLTPERE